jgi:hypothetical protein
MKAVCRQFQSGRVNNLTPQIAAIVAPPIEVDLATVAAAFVELQDARHSADYDTSIPLTKQDVLQKITMAEQAFVAWGAVRNAPNRAVFLTALLLNRQWREA